MAMRRGVEEKIEIEVRRRTAVRMRRQGHSIEAIADALEIDASTVHRYLASYRESGYEGLLVQWSSGRPPKLEEPELRELEELLLIGPEEHGFAESFWSGGRVAQLIKEHFGVDYHERYVPELLRRMGWSIQKPNTRAVERNDELIEDWKGFQWRRIRQRAKRKKATIVFIDETGVLSSPYLRRTWAPKGETPVVDKKARGPRLRMSLIGAIAVDPAFTETRLFFRSFPGASCLGTDFRSFLNYLTRAIDGPLIVVWDGLRGHKSREVKEFLATCKRLTIEFFPPYAPELNPVEYLWAWLKNKPLANSFFSSLDHMKDKAYKALRAAQAEGDLLLALALHALSYLESPT